MPDIKKIDEDYRRLLIEKRGELISELDAVEKRIEQLDKAIGGRAPRRKAGRKAPKSKAPKRKAAKRQSRGVVQAAILSAVKRSDGGLRPREIVIAVSKKGIRATSARNTIFNMKKAKRLSVNKDGLYSAA